MTHKKSRYAVVYGRMVEFFSRPSPTHSKQYREPVKAGCMWCKNKKCAERAKRKWEAA